MAATTVRELQLSSGLESYGVAYMFCNYKDPVTVMTQNALASILRQLLENKPSAAESLLWLHDKHKMHQTYPSTQELRAALRHVVEVYASVYLIIDALDEMLDDGEIRRLVGYMCDLQPYGNVHLLFTSRYIPQIMNEILDTRIIEIRAEAADIKAFIQEHAASFPRIARDNLELMERISCTII